MRTIYIDNDFKCHAENTGGLVAIETESFDGKCVSFIEGYRFVPEGETWVRDDGVSFAGEMISPWKDYTELEAVQREYERQMLAEYEEALKVLGVTV